MAQLFKGPFTVESYQRLGELGILRQDERVELIDGQVVAMTPIGPGHAGCVAALHRLLGPQVGVRGVVWVQNPVALGQRVQPQPDVAVLAPRADAYRTTHPHARDVVLVIEVADTSLAYDRDTKIPLYAEAGIPEAWLVDLAGERIGVHREPRGAAYTRARWAGRGETLGPLRLPDIALAVADILGPPLE